MDVSFAIGWDNENVADQAGRSVRKLSDLAVRLRPQVIDTEHLKYYRPYCSRGNLNGVTPDERLACEDSALVSPSSPDVEVPNHRLIEGWAVFAAPSEPNVVLNVALADAFPVFENIKPRRW